MGCAGYLPREKRHRVFKQIKNAAQLIEINHGLGRRVLDGHLLAKGKDRQLRRTAPGNANQLDHVLQQVLVFPRTFGSHQNAGQTVVRRSNNAPFSGAGGGQNTETVLLQFLSDGAHPVTGHGIGHDVTVHNQDGELEVFIHCGVPEERQVQACLSLQIRGSH